MYPNSGAVRAYLVHYELLVAGRVREVPLRIVECASQSATLEICYAAPIGLSVLFVRALQGIRCFSVYFLNAT